MTTLDKNIRKSSAAPVWNWGDISVQFFKEKCFTSTAYQLQNSHDGVTACVYGRLKNTERKYPKHKLKIIPWSENWQRNNMNKLWKSLWSSTDDNSSGWYVRNLACNARMVISMESVTSEIVSSVCWSKKKQKPFSLPEKHRLSSIYPNKQCSQWIRTQNETPITLILLFQKGLNCLSKRLIVIIQYKLQ